MPIRSLDEAGEAAPFCRHRHPPVHGFAQFCRIGRVGGAGVGGSPYRRFGEFALALLLHAEENFVFEKTAARQNVDELFFDFAHLQFAGTCDESRPQIELCLSRRNRRGTEPAAEE